MRFYGLALSLVLAAGAATARSAPQPLVAFLQQVEVASPLQYGPVAFYPLRLPGARDDMRPFVTLQEAVNQGSLVLTECTPMQQNALLLQVARQGGIPSGGGFLGQGGGIFGQGGGIQGGGFQGRATGRDFFQQGGVGGGFGTAPGTGETQFALNPGADGLLARSVQGSWTLPVFCIEPFRSGGSSPLFIALDALAPVRVRARMLTALSAEAQSEVWEVCKAELSQRGLLTRSRTLLALYEAPQTAMPATEVADSLGWHPGWGKDAVGLIAMAGGRVLGVDVYANPILFEKMRRALLASYTLDAMSLPPDSPVPAQKLQAWLPVFSQAQAVPEPPVADGDYYRLTLPGWIGSVLLAQGGIVHWGMYPG